MHTFLKDDLFDTVVSEIKPDKTIGGGFIDVPHEFWDSPSIVYEMYARCIPEYDYLVRIGMTTNLYGRFKAYRSAAVFVKNGGTYEQQNRSELVDGRSIHASQSIKFYKPKTTHGWSEVGKYLIGPRDLAQATEAYRISYWKKRGKKLHNPQTPSLQPFQHIIDIAA